MRKKVDYDKLYKLRTNFKNKNAASKYRDAVNNIQLLYDDKNNCYIYNPEIIYFRNDEVHASNIDDTIILKLKKKSKIIQEFSNILDEFWNIILVKSPSEIDSFIDKILNGEIIEVNLDNGEKGFHKTEGINDIKELLEKINCYHEPFWEVFFKARRVKEVFPGLTFSEKIGWLKDEDLLQNHLVKLKNAKYPIVFFRDLEKVIEGKETLCIDNADEVKAAVSLIRYWQENDFIQNTKKFPYNLILNNFDRTKQRTRWKQKGLEKLVQIVVSNNDRGLIESIEDILNS